MPWIDVPKAPGAQRARARAREDRPGFEIRNAAADEAELLIYDEIDSWWGVAAADVIAVLATITAPRLRVRVNSPGGSVFEGLAIANALRSHPANVTVQVDGLAASIASVIALAGDQLVMMPNSMLMIHDASGLCMGDASDMQQMGVVLDKISDNIAGAYAAKAGGTTESWRGTMRAETWYLPDEAVAAGLADEAVAATPADDDPAMRANWDLTAYGYQGPKQPEKPKPGPPPVKATAEEKPAPTLVISIAEILDEDAVARLRAAVQAAPEDVSTEPLGTGPDETAAGPAAPPVAAEPAAPIVPAAEPAAPAGDDGWNAVIARLTTPEPDPWAAALAHLTQTPASSATDA
ncbi:head maturation protease, ClpP-related [Streptomyces sp. V4-01]|uniref:ATP-dependent Clp protease proteolytic subunit n=1 Tax=Actinacidiphila polyblastidii TaxID=3110430 RepID=A0ABU7PKU5_9ACTN|nr:head maturation protease, ClpP-related [Streptomyces sp. V4-01]